MNIIEKTNLLTSFIEELGKNSNEARRAKIAQVCGTARYLAYNIRWEDDDVHPEYIEAYNLIYNEVLRTLRWYTKELQQEDKLSRKQFLFAEGYSYKQYRKTLTRRRPRRKTE